MHASASELDCWSVCVWSHLITWRMPCFRSPRFPEAPSSGSLQLFAAPHSTVLQKNARFQHSESDSLSTKCRQAKLRRVSRHQSNWTLFCCLLSVCLCLFCLLLVDDYWLLLVVGCWWLVVGGWSLVVGRRSCVVGCWSLVIGRWSLVVGAWWLVVGGWRLAVGCWVLGVGCWLLDVGCWLLSVVGCCL